MVAKKNEKKFDFEKALKEIEVIVEELERGELSLDESLARYEKGVKLSKECQKKIDVARDKIEKLIKKEDGSFVNEPFDEEEGS